MPTYEYRCRSCGTDLEAVQSFDDDPLTTCPECGGPLRKVFGTVGIAFKGSGFYKNDSRSGSGSRAGSAASGTGSTQAEPSSTAGSDSGGGAGKAGDGPATGSDKPSSGSDKSASGTTGSSSVSTGSGTGSGT